MKLQVLISLFLILCWHMFPKDHAVLSDWEVGKSYRNISISYRWLHVGDTLKTREMKTVFTVNATTEAILKQFKNDAKLRSWTAGIKDCYIVQATDNEWITYTLYNIPWPFTNNDLVTKYKLDQHQKYTRINLESLPDHVPYHNGVERITHYTGSWLFIPLEDGRTAVEFRSISFTKPLFPRFIQDPVLQDILISSMVKFKTQAEAEQ